MLEDTYIITGPPHCGKTTLTRALRERGYTAIGEVARPLIRQQKSLELQKRPYVLPWTDNYRFQQMLLPWQIAREERHRAREQRNAPLFSERGVPDSIGYSRFWKHEVPPDVSSVIAQRRYTEVYLLEAIPGYKTDSERKETAQDAAHLWQLILEGYRDAGYRPVLVPFMPLEERVQWVVDRSRRQT